MEDIIKLLDFGLSALVLVLVFMTLKMLFPMIRDFMAKYLDNQTQQLGNQQKQTEAMMKIAEIGASLGQTGEHIGTLAGSLKQTAESFQAEARTATAILPQVLASLNSMQETQAQENKKHEIFLRSMMSEFRSLPCLKQPSQCPGE